jgi:hypothetical protein
VVPLAVRDVRVARVVARSDPRHAPFRAAPVAWRCLAFERASFADDGVRRGVRLTDGDGVAHTLLAARSSSRRSLRLLFFGSTAADARPPQRLRGEFTHRSGASCHDRHSGALGAWDADRMLTLVESDCCTDDACTAHGWWQWWLAPDAWLAACRRFESATALPGVLAPLVFGYVGFGPMPAAPFGVPRTP